MPRRAIPCTGDTIELDGQVTDNLIRYRALDLICTLDYWDVYGRQFAFKIGFACNKADGSFYIVDARCTPPPDF
jgi:hypothetical protein